MVPKENITDNAPRKRQTSKQRIYRWFTPTTTLRRASKIIEAYIRAAGGSDPLARLSAVEFQGTVIGTDPGRRGPTP